MDLEEGDRTVSHLPQDTCQTDGHGLDQDQGHGHAQGQGLDHAHTPGHTRGHHLQTEEEEGGPQNEEEDDTGLGMESERWFVFRGNFVIFLFTLLQICHLVLVYWVFIFSGPLGSLSLFQV